MNIQIIETSARETLSILDPKSGMDFIQDLMGNHDALPDYNDDLDAYEMTQADFDWWLDLTARYEKQDHRMHKIRKDADDRDAFDSAWESYNASNDLDDLPSYMEQFCDAWEAGEFEDA